METNIAAIVANPSEYGFRWVDGEEVSTQDKDVSLGKVPLPIVTDTVKFSAAFPGRIEAMLDGSSLRVIAQGVARRMRVKDHGAKPDAIKVQQVLAIVGLKAKAAQARVYLLPDDSTTTDKAEFLAAWGIEGA